jgi:hypothetical protein
MKYKITCGECGHQDTAYLHSLNLGKVQALRKLVDFYELHKRPCQMEQLYLSNSQYTNFGHLQYFKLALHIPDGWIPTEDGIAFIHGEIPVIQQDVHTDEFYQRIMKHGKLIMERGGSHTWPI